MSRVTAQNQMDSITSVKENDFYEIVTVPIPEGIVLGVGGMALLPNDKLAVATRRGEVWTISNPYTNDGLPPDFKLFARGLHEPLGLAYHDGALYAAQRPELTRLKDLDGDGSADEYKTVYPFHISGNYHEYAYGPVLDKEGNMAVTLNLAWVGHMESVVKWRGWMLKISKDGEMVPIATGFRSPAAFGLNKDGDMFYAENQGGWIGSGYIMALEKGDFASHPAGLKWSGEPDSPVQLSIGDIPDTGRPQFEVAKDIHGMKPPSVWIPHGYMGVSTSDILLDNKGGFGPFQDQIFVGDQGQSLINRVFLEKVDGVYQGAVFPFRKGFSSGVFRMCWGSDGSMFVGMTGRGWGSTGGELFGLQRLVWNGKMPFEVKAIRAMPDGFELEFTKAVDEKTAKDAASYHINTFTYKYHHEYGSPVINQGEGAIKAIEVSQDRMKVRLVVEGKREGYIHEIDASGVRSDTENYAVLHPTGYYTLNRIPDGPSLNITAANRIEEKVGIDERSTGNGGPKESIQVEVIVGKQQAKEKTAPANKITFNEVLPLLEKYTCTSCHNTIDRQVGPPFVEIAERGYSVDRTIELIYKPQLDNWPDYATPMPPMGHVPQADVQKIAEWIGTLGE
jgi:cytochrome c551/c552